MLLDFSYLDRVMNIATVLIIVAVIGALAVAFRILKKKGLDECSSCTRKDGCSDCPYGGKEE